MSTIDAYAPRLRAAARHLPRSDAGSGTDAAPQLDTIFIEGFRGETVIGIDPDELLRAQPVVIDLSAGRLRLRACDSDRIGDTIDYAAVRQRLVDYLRTHGHTLLEAFAEGFAAVLIDEFAADWVQISVAKPNKFPDVERVGVRIERHRRRFGESADDGTQTLRFLGAGSTPGTQ